MPSVERSQVGCATTPCVTPTLIVTAACGVSITAHGDTLWTDARWMLPCSLCAPVGRMSPVGR